MDEELFYESEWKKTKGEDFQFLLEEGDFPKIKQFSKWLTEIDVEDACVDTIFDENEIDNDCANDMARKRFGVRFLFPWQRLVIENVLLGSKGNSDFSHQIVILPTGAGKSMCFLVPALLLPKPTLIFYPLLSLMADQKRRMDEAGIEAAVFCGEQSEREREENFLKIENGAKIALANPEIMQNKKVFARLSKIGFSHIAVDEAHCVSEWGDTFRPAYLTLGNIIADLKPSAVSAFTATASPAVLSRVGDVLFSGKFHLVRGGSDRPNIQYSVFPSVSKMHDALVLSSKMEKPLLIFCSTRNRAEKMGRLCAELFGTERARFYHAGLDASDKKEIEKWFFSSEDGILCATCAYGMGVDKPNIRSVIHLDSSSNVEAFCQESGRAGRDGKKASSVLLWSADDSYAFKRKGEREKAMLSYASTSFCRREFLLSYLSDFESSKTACSGCDVCLGNAKKVSEQEREALDFVKKHGKFYNRSEIENALTERFVKKSLEKLGVAMWESADTKSLISSLDYSRKIVLKKHSISIPSKKRLPRKMVRVAFSVRFFVRKVKKTMPLPQILLRLRFPAFLLAAGQTIS